MSPISAEFTQPVRRGGDNGAEGQTVALASHVQTGRLRRKKARPAGKAGTEEAQS